MSENANKKTVVEKEESFDWKGALLKVSVTFAQSFMIGLATAAGAKTFEIMARVGTSESNNVVSFETRKAV